MFGSRRLLSLRGAVGRRAAAAMVVALAAAYISVPAAHANTTIAFQANTGELWYWGNEPGYEHGAGHDLHLGMMKGTSPSITDDGFIRSWLHIAFQANTGNLWEYSSSSGAGHDRHLGMMAGTSPSLATDAVAETIAFQANTGSLWQWGYSSGGELLGPDNALGSDLGGKLMKGTSPSINGGEIAYQGHGGHLWTTRHGNTGLAMMPGTSPSSISSESTSRVAFQANNGHLWIWDGSRGRDLGLAMAAGTSPSMGGGEIAFQGANGHLWLWEGLGDGSETHLVTDSGLGMAMGTSPSLAGGGQIAFQANTGHLWLAAVGSKAGIGKAHDLHLGMMAGTSPSIVYNAWTSRY